jgi:hypothetical protein
MLMLLMEKQRTTLRVTAGASLELLVDMLSWCVVTATLTV